MNGWQRIGIVLAVLFGVPAFLIAYADSDGAYGYVYPSEEVKALQGQDFWNALYQQAQSEDPELYEGCINSTVEMRKSFSDYDGAYTVTCDKTVTHSAANSIVWGVLPGLIFWVIGMTVAWVIAGFRRRSV